MSDHLSQVAGILAPTNVLVALIAIGLVFEWARPARSFGGRLTVIAATALVFLAITPAGDWMLAPLESRFAPLAPDGRPVAGIIVLGGSLSEVTIDGVLEARPTQSVDRIFEAARLARHYPRATVLVSGGPDYPHSHLSEADFVSDYLNRLGVPKSQILRERLSRNTFENAQFSAALVRPRPAQRWLLVTSAFHMPRAVACFRKAGFTVLAAPADWRENPPSWPIERLSWSASGNLGKVDLAWKEYLGLVVYRFRGRTDILFPGP